jgi:hypothetical protein
MRQEWSVEGDAGRTLCPFVFRRSNVALTADRYAVMHTRPRDKTENDRDMSRTVETTPEWRDWARKTAASRDQARRGENLRITILRANPACANKWCWTPATVMKKARIKWEFWRSVSPLRRGMNSSLHLEMGGRVLRAGAPRWAEGSCAPSLEHVDGRAA